MTLFFFAFYAAITSFISCSTKQSIAYYFVQIFIISPIPRKSETQLSAFRITSRSINSTDTTQCGSLIAYFTGCKLSFKCMRHFK